jgi:flavodoxin
MKKIVIYSSQTSNTKKLAEGAAAVLACGMLPVTEVGEIDHYDFLAVGFWFKGGQPDPSIQELLPKLAGKKVFFFASHGAATDSDHARNGMNQAIELAAGAEIIGSFHCPGEVPEKVQAAVREKNPKAPWLLNAPDAAGHPNAQDIDHLQTTLLAAMK